MAASTPIWGSPEWADAYILQHGFPPIAGGDGTDDPDPKDDPEPDKPGTDDPDPKDDPDKVDSADDWKTKSRKNENAAKAERKKREALERQIAELQDKDKTEQQKAVDKAREEARTEALSEAEKERCGDRLEVAVTRAASKGVTVGEGDKARTVKFADPEDALLRVERSISRGEIDADDIYDDEGRVKTEALTTALVEIASANTHLVGEGERPKPKGESDARKGEPGSSDLEAMSPEDHVKRKYGTK